VAEVGLVGGAVVVVRLAEDDDVVAATEGILEDGGRTEVDVGVMPRGLVGGRPVEVPDAELADVGDLGLDGLERVSGQKRGAGDNVRWSLTSSRCRRQSRHLQRKDEEFGLVRGASGHTFSLDLLALREGKIGGEQVVPVEDGHCRMEECFFDLRRPTILALTRVYACLLPKPATAPEHPLSDWAIRLKCYLYFCVLTPEHLGRTGNAARESPGPSPLGALHCPAT
jgi:hypothetical protein